MAADLSPHDAVLDEAALRFAAGDAPGAAQVLSAALADPGLAPAQAHRLHDTLLDLCCATGDARRFEALALQGAQRFQASPPSWSHLPQALAAWRASRGEAALPDAAPAGRAHWQALPLLRAADLPRAEGAARTDAPWVLDWSRCLRIDPAAVPALVACLHGWAEAPLALLLVGGEAMDGCIERTLQDPAAPPACWLLHLAWLRLAGRAEAFEAQALAYCQRFEQSPPAWVPPSCTLVAEEGAPPATPTSGPGLPRWWGEVLGDALPLWWTGLDDPLLPPGPLRIDASLLLRLDFVAATALLNWAQARPAAARPLTLLHLHRPLARLLQLVGLEAHAALHLRK